MTLLAIFATLFGSIMDLGYLTQAYKMYRTRSVRDISPLSFGIFFFGNFTWEIYGISITNWPLMISSAFGIAGTSLVLAFYFIFYKETAGEKRVAA